VAAAQTVILAGRRWAHVCDPFVAGRSRKRAHAKHAKLHSSLLMRLMRPRPLAGDQRRQLFLALKSHRLRGDFAVFVYINRGN